MQDITMFMISYLAVLLIAFFIINWLQRGLLFNFLRVKTSRGKKVLCKVRGKTEDYYVPAEPKDDGLILKFKNDKKISTLSKVPSDCFYRSAGVTMVDIDEVSKMAVSKNWSAVQTSDPQINSALIKRAQMSPGEEEKLIKILLVIMIINVLGTLALIMIIMGDVKTTLESLKEGAQVVGNNI